MVSPRAVRVRSAAVPMRLAVVVVSLLVYAAATLLAHPVLGGISLAFSFVPVAVAAWLFGLRGGMGAAMAAIPINATLLIASGESDIVSLTIGRRGITGQLILFGTALVTGLLRDRSIRLHGELRRGREAQAKLEAMVSAKDRFLASISHELRTPLTAVLGFSSILADSWRTSESADIDELTTAIRQQAADAAHIIEDLLVAARADLGSLLLHPQEIDVREEVRSVLGSIADAGTIPVRGEAVVACADPLRTRQIVRNLATNAIRYGGENIYVEVVRTPGTACVRVVDDGEGIPMEEVERVFDAYYSLADQRSKPGSVGVGLSIARQLARLMGGDLTYSAPAGLCSFTLMLPERPTGQVDVPVHEDARLRSAHSPSMARR